MIRLIVNIALLALILFVVAASPLAAQDAPAHQAVPYSEKAEKKFSYALSYFENGTYYTAARQFLIIVDRYDLNHRTTAAYIMAARARHLSGSPKSAVALCQELLKKFPESRYRMEAFLVKGDALCDIGKFERALQSYVDAYRSATRAGDLTTLLARMDSCLVRPLDPMKTEAIIAGTKDHRLVMDHLYAGWTRYHDDSSARKPDRHPQREAAERTRPATIIVALPQSPSDLQRSRISHDLRDGILAALDVHRRSNGHPADLRFVDSEATATLADDLTRIAAESDVLGVIGGAFSSDAIAVANACSRLSLPCYLPTATKEGLASRAEGIFQFNTPMAMRGELLADFSRFELKLREVAIVAPKEDPEHTIAEGFRRRCVSIQLPIRADVRYDRRMLVSKTAEIVASLRREKIREYTAIFIPSATQDELLTLLPALEAAGIQNTIVGTGDWRMEALKHLGSAGMRHIVCASEAQLDTVSMRGKSFLQAYRRRSSRQLTKDAAFGFDACSMMLSMYQAGGNTPSEIRKRSSGRYEGLRSPVDFSDGNVNRALRIQEFRNGKQVRLDSFFGR